MTIIVAAGVVSVESFDAFTVASAVPGFERPAEMKEVTAVAVVDGAVTVTVHTNSLSVAVKVFQDSDKRTDDLIIKQNAAED